MPGVGPGSSACTVVPGEPPVSVGRNELFRAPVVASNARTYGVGSSTVGSPGDSVVVNDPPTTMVDPTCATAKTAPSWITGVFSCGTALTAVGWAGEKADASGAPSRPVATVSATARTPVRVRVFECCMLLRRSGARYGSHVLRHPS